MSTASPALPGKPSLGGLLARIVFIVILWAALVAGTLHYVGYLWPKAYQISLAEKEEADEKAQTAFNTPAPAPAAAAPATSAKAGTTAASSTSSAPAAAPAAASTAKATSAAPAASSSSASAPAASTATAITAATPAASSASTQTAAPTAASAPKATSSAPATSAAPAAASSATPAPVAASAPKAASGEQPLPHDLRLAGYNRTALENVSIFFSIVISVFCVGAIILQIFNYKHVEEEAAH